MPWLRGGCALRRIVLSDNVPTFFPRPRAPLASPFVFARTFTDAAEAAVPPAPAKTNKFSLGGAIDEILTYVHRDALMFPEHMHEELRKRTVTAVKAQVNLLRSQAVRVDRERLDDLLLEAITREGSALAANDEERVRIMCPEAPHVGDDTKVDGRAAKVVDRHVIFDGQAVRLVISANLLNEAGEHTDNIVKEVFDIVSSDFEAVTDSNMPRLEEANRARFDELLALDHYGGRPGREALNGEDVDRALYQELLGKDPIENPTEGEMTDMQADMEDAMFAGINADLEKEQGPAPELPDDMIFKDANDHYRKTGEF